jgi:hypothetical protein
MLSKYSHMMSAIFITEALIKSIVQGFLFNGPGSYLKNGWNIFDFFIVLVSAATEIGHFINTVNSDKLKVIQDQCMLDFD